MNQTVIAISALSEEEVKFPPSLKFRHFLVRKSGLPTPEIAIHFSRRVKAEFSPVDGTVMANFSSGGQSDECVYSPTETTITGGATFCVAGSNMSAVFIGGNPLPNSPNTPIHYQH
ncbi:hypothetical protein M9Y10_003290 [Tritrichomonas musculus]|uniref:Uncharacterized protein n=1 Tax=Tritrichomonas musculus TaxID=1915356 RepID=A0ABR2JQ78_9EUKA